MSKDLLYIKKQSLCSKRTIRLKNNPTKSELLFKLKLDNLGIKYIFQKGFYAGNNFCIADFYIPKPYKIVIEIDGSYHLNKEQIIRDRNKDDYYKSRGFKIIHIKNEDVENYNVNSLITF